MTEPRESPIPSTPRETPEPTEGERVSTVIGDRVCVTCGFNLYGQPVVKESRYGMFVARCPECGTPAALQEYPVLGRWANRWAALAAALWLGVLALGGFGVAMVAFGLSMNAVHSGSTDYAHHISVTAQAEGQSSGPSGLRFTSQSGVPRQWWDDQDRWEMLREAGGFRAAAADAYPLWVSMAVIGFVIGAMASVAMLHVRRLRVVMLALLLPGVAATFQVFWYSSWLLDEMGNQVIRASTLALHTLGPWLFGISDGVFYAGLCVGALTGRTLTRWMATALLPPRLRSALGLLWTAEGKTPPKPR